MRINFIMLTFLFFSQQTFAVAKIQHWQTLQGTPVFFVQTQGLPMVDVRVVIDAGSARDGGKQGIASLTSALLDAGAGSWNADEIAQRFESVGAQFSTGVSRDMAWLTLRSLTDKRLLNEALETMREILTQPTFNSDDFNRERNRVLAGLKHREESPGAIASIEFYKALYGDHPYAHPTDGFINTVSAITANDLKAFYKQYYVASNAMVVIVGDMSRQQAEKTAESLITGLTIGSKSEPIPEVPSASQIQAIKRVKHIEFPSTQTHVLAGSVGMHRKDKDYFDLYVGNHILGGSGLVSLMVEEVREKRGLAYSAYSYFSPMLRKGPFTMGLQTRNDQTDQAVQVMLNTLRNFVQQGPTEKVLEAAKKNITGGFVMRIDTNSKLLAYVSMIGFYQLPLDYLDRFQERVKQVTVASIKNAFKRRVNPDLIQVITVGRTEKARAGEK